jgi:hypothetical protein
VFQGQSASINTATANHKHNGFTGNSGAHAHNFGATGTGTGSISYDGGGAVGGNTAAAQPAVGGTTDTQSHLPPYVDFVFCQKQ